MTPMNNSRPTRRGFLKTTAAIAPAVYVGHSKVGYAQDERAERSANGQVNYAGVGVGGKGRGDTKDASDHGEIVAICDVDAATLRKEGKRYKNAEQFADFREMFEKLGDKIDACTVSTPDHMHAVTAAMAMKNGAAVYCQKPLTRTMWEARQLADMARDKGLATQMGNQGTALDSLRSGAAVVKSGKLGTLEECHIFTNRPVWEQGTARPEPSEAPEELNWDLWLGTAPERPHAKGYHPFGWRGWWDFGTGALGDMACHTFNLPYMALDLKDASSVVAETTGHNGDSFPQSSKIVFQFDALGDRPAMPVYWYDGGNKPSEDLLNGYGFKPNDKNPRGCIIKGSDLTFYSWGDYGGDWALIDADGNEVPKPENIEFESSPGHFTEFHQAITGERKQAVSNFEDYSGKLTETILLGNLAVWTDGEKVEWDAENLEATNMKGDETIAQLIKPNYRGDYSL